MPQILLGIDKAIKSFVSYYKQCNVVIELLYFFIYSYKY